MPTPTLKILPLTLGAKAMPSIRSNLKLENDFCSTVVSLSPRPWSMALRLDILRGLLVVFAVEPKEDAFTQTTGCHCPFQPNIPAKANSLAKD